MVKPLESQGVQSSYWFMNLNTSTPAFCLLRGVLNFQNVIWERVYNRTQTIHYSSVLLLCSGVAKSLESQQSTHLYQRNS